MRIMRVKNKEKNSRNERVEEKREGEREKMRGNETAHLQHGQTRRKEREGVEPENEQLRGGEEERKGKKK